MELKIWCPTCNGKKQIWSSLDKEIRKKMDCPYCNGIGMENPPQQVLDDLECAEIERELLKYNNLVYSLIDVNSLGITYIVVVGSFEGDLHKERGTTKLETWRQAKTWLYDKYGE